MPLQSIVTKQVLLLRARDMGHFVCDEYNQLDGRVHILRESCYGTFDRDSFVLEFRKVAFDIASIVYEGPDWPSRIAGSKDWRTILSHFGRPM